MNDIEAKDAAIEQARTDGAVATYFTMERLLSAFMPADFRAEIRQAFEERGPVPKEAEFCVANILLDGTPDGKWCVRFPDHRNPYYTLVIACDRVRYERARKNYRELMARKRLQVPFN